MPTSTRGTHQRILLLGKDGQVGWELQRTLALLGTVVALNRGQLNLADFNESRAIVREVKPTLIVNAAAYTAVDKAEEERELAMAVNGVAPGILAEEAKHLGAAIVHYSTDYVFDGTKTAPYIEKDQSSPINTYGRTKLRGEQAIQAADVPHLILRTSWIYGMRGRNFLLTILRLVREREELKVVDDQIGAPTWSRLVAEATAQILAQGKGSLVGYLEQAGGLYHLAASGETTWYGFAKAIVELDPGQTEQTPKALKPVPASEYLTAARRPAYSVLGSDKLSRTFALDLPDWRTQLKLVLDGSDEGTSRCT